MKNLMQEIDNIITECNVKINNKILGLNYLDQLKYALIDKLKILKIENLKTNEYSNITKQYGSNKLYIKLDSYPDLITQIKNEITEDHLSIIITGSKSIEIYENKNSKKKVSLKLFKYMGIILSKNTLVSHSIAKNTLILNIFNKNADIEKSN